VFISFDRYNAIVRGFAAKPLTFCKVFVILFVVWTWALAWSIGPLFFGGYAMEGILASCAFDYLNLEPFNVVYIWSCFIFCYCMPLSVIISSYYSIVKAVFAHERALREQAKKMNVASLRSNEDAQKLSAEIRIAKVRIIMAIMSLKINNFRLQ
jgi:r-opsin